MHFTFDALVYVFDETASESSLKKRIIKKARHRAWLRTRCAEAQNWRCCYCQKEMTLEANGSRRVTLEHVTPVSLGGTDDYDNCAAACSSCNNKRQNKPLDENGMIIEQKSSKDFLGKKVRRIIKLHTRGEINSRGDLENWLKSTKTKEIHVDYLVEVIRKQSGIKLAA